RLRWCCPRWALRRAGLSVAGLFVAGLLAVGWWLSHLWVDCLQAHRAAADLAEQVEHASRGEGCSLRLAEVKVAQLNLSGVVRQDHAQLAPTAVQRLHTQNFPGKADPHPGGELGDGQHARSVLV